MSASTAIGRVSESLRALLLGEMSFLPAVPVTILAPDEPGGGNRRINLFLYKVQEHPFLRNQDWQVNPSNTSQLRPPPLSLSLFYLLTPFAQNDNNLGNTRRHELLGEAMRVFHENQIIPDGYLTGDLGDAREEIRIMPAGMDMEELSQIWGTFSEPFRLSVLYEVSVVQIDQSAAQERPMPQRVREIGVPDVRAPYAPPAVESISPIAGPAGTVVTFNGTQMDGWQANASVMGQTILAQAPITGDSFQATIPGDLQPGFHEIRIDVSGLFRRVFFFEVTP